MKIDPRLTVPCEKPVINGNTNRDVWALAIEQNASIVECDARMKIIRILSE